MSFKKCLDHFSVFTVLPIEVDDVRDWVVNRCDVDRVDIHLTDMNPATVKGLLVRYTYRPAPYAQLETIATIHVSSQISLEWQRVVVCKELIHLFDGAHARARTPEDLDHLIETIASGGANGFHGMKAAAVIDFVSVARALMLLCPTEAVELLRARLLVNKITLNEIATLFAIPPELVGMVMAPEFVALREVLGDL